jgi:adenosylcobinamide kinase/adenosylcobinamide-phosphate guanylyltransferase
MAGGQEDFRIALILGGARSGKSRYGLSLALTRPAPRLYLATGEAGDEEMAARIARHRRERGEEWDTQEIPLDLPQAISGAQGQYGVILVDCLTLWLSNLMTRDLSGAELQAACDHLLTAVQATNTPLVLVSNEVGWGIVPENPLARAFRDRAGLLHQQLAAAADLVLLMVAGLPVRIKGA